MRIISNFKDYYDCVQGISFDKSVVYHRNPIEETRKDWPFKRMGFMNGFLNAYSWMRVVGFCGKEYYCLRVDKCVDNYNGIDVQVNCYSAEEFLHCLEFKEKDGQMYFRRSRYNPWYRYNSRDVEQLYELFKPVESGFSPKHPIFLAQYGKNITIEYNASLREMNFERIKDPYSAFQELRMWMSNQANPEKPIPVMSDNIKIEARGFDKFSFRKEPSKRKK